MPRAKILTAAVLTALAVAACVTINVYFPEAAVKDLSERIEDAVAREAEEGGAEAAAEPEGEGAAGSGLVSRLRSGFEIAVGTALHVLGPAPAYAQPPPSSVAEPEISNPAIRRIVQSRAARVNQLNRYKSSGALGENNKALVQVRDLNALPLQERAAVQKLVRDENADRDRMFKEIAAATGVDLSQLPRIQETYARTLREKARRGDWIQLEDGRWDQKR